MKRSTLISFALLIATIGAALAGFPSSGRVFPSAATLTAFQYCWPGADISAPCTVQGAAPVAKSQPLSATNTFTVITKLTSGALNPFPGKSNYILSLLGLASSTYHVDAAWIGQSAATGSCAVGSGTCPYDFVNPTQITSAAANAFTVPSGAQLTLDTVAGTLVSGVAYTVAFDITSGSYPFVTPNTTTFNTNPKACGTGNGCTYTSYAIPVAGTAVMTAKIDNGAGGAGTTLNVSAVTSGRIHIGSAITGAGVAANTRVTALGTGTGTTGTYTVNNSQNVSSEAMGASHAASLAKFAGTNTTTAAANTAYVTTSNIVAILGTFKAQ